MDIKRENEGGRRQWFMKKENTSLIDVENIETTYLDNCAFFSALASYLLLFCLIHLSLASLTFCVIYFTVLTGVCVFIVSVGVIRLNIATTSARRLKFVL